LKNSRLQSSHGVLIGFFQLVQKGTTKKLLSVLFEVLFVERSTLISAFLEKFYEIFKSNEMKCSDHYNIVSGAESLMLFSMYPFNSLQFLFWKQSGVGCYRFRNK